MAYPIFPLSCAVLVDGFGCKVHRKKRYLAGKSLAVSKDTISGVIRLTSDHEAETLLNFWRDELDYGYEYFIMSLPMFGDIKDYKVKFKTDLGEDYTTRTSRQVKFELEVDGEYIVVTSCDTSIGGVDGTLWNETGTWEDTCKMFEG